ncbi:restriction endonuclease subunit S [Vibrio fluvialis]|jgi:type I restriction enzyme S subunit|uniref:Restriction endonuclease subunit S n=1 Tax=Vibrio cholerae TaxID=666 RepID=A0A7Z7VL13_VIBCL|nr:MULTISPECIES: restriction endonuclease subunit S [Vibrio]MCR9297708.1 restriction endonuclease subunit S [Vibrio fluvialis]PNV70534.1 restriction endonuclease subunit S [Vibrio cholerae]TBM38716.1 restriction endonuclease subunit S [Vibrio cholerae]CQB48938.1 Type I restriction-modification system, specificity subunit S [Vibrio cholerae]
MESITSTPKYDQYIDSGYEWIGEIPLHWDLVKLGSCLSPVSVKNCSELPLLSITREQGVIERDVDDQESNHNFIPDDLSGYKKLEKGQFGMNKMKAWQGSYGVSKFTGIVSPAYFVFDFTKAINPEFFNWAIRSKLYISFFGSASDGVRIGQWDLSKTRMKVIPFVLPSEEEQSLIANFLDKKATQINDAIAIKEQQISLLKERKQIIIQQAVTQGLDPNVPMKDSGVDWIGKIPAHWETVRSRWLFKQRREKARKEDEQLTASQKYGVISQQQYMELEGRRVTQVEFNSEILKHVEANDFVISMRSFQGGIEFCPYAGCVSSAYVPLIPNSKVYSPYFKHLLKSSRYIEALQSTSNLVRDGQALRYENFCMVDLLIVPEEEQVAIAKYIDDQNSLTEMSTIQLEAQIERLKEYKTTLINSAVTGKIKITPEMVEQ